MICLSKNENGPDILIEYMGGTLDPVRAAELERHMEECAECRGLANMRTALGEWETPEVSADFDRRLYARIGAEEKARWWTRTWWKPAIPLAACAALVAGFLMTHEPRPADQLKASIEPTNMEQVEQALEDMDLLAPAAQGTTEAL